MILFFEGNPRSGKSLNAVKDHIIPMLKSGRTVYAYIEGLNHEAIAKLAEIDIDLCRSLLIQITREEVPKWYEIAKPDSFIILDEAQNFWPDQRKPLDADTTMAITEHGHQGQDILLMGQVFKDVHKTWIGRCDQRDVFVKREAVGKPDEFTRIIMKPIRTGDRTKWQEINREKGVSYDKSIFGAYKSHTEGTTNKATLIDKKATVWSNKILTRYAPIVLGVACFAMYHLYGAFFGGGLAESFGVPKEGSLVAETRSDSKTLSSFSAELSPSPKPIDEPHEPKRITHEEIEHSFQPVDEIDKLTSETRIRLAGFIKLSSINGWVEWRTESEHLVQRLTFDELKAYGWTVLVSQSGTVGQIVKGNRTYMMNSWPLKDDHQGRVPKTAIAQISASSPSNKPVHW